jgi:hypothetical protein
MPWWGMAKKKSRAKRFAVQLFLAYGSVDPLKNRIQITRADGTFYSLACSEQFAADFLESIKAKKVRVIS